jgi:hypothetical protein
MKKFHLLIVILALLGLILACKLPFIEESRLPSTDESTTAIQDAQPADLSAQDADDNPSTSPPVFEGVPSLSPDALIYAGAFQLPDDSGGLGWGYSGQGMTYYPGGDPDGEADGFPGSLFVVGHDYQLQVAEVTIPVPVISKNLDDLHTAQTLQPFADITGGYITEALSLPVMGIEYLPARNGLGEEKLFFTIGQHFQVFEPSHGWASLDLSDPNPAGLWVFDGYSNYATSDYLFEIPREWAETYVNGYSLGSGRFREGVWSGFGPALFACAPWMDGNPPASGSTLTAVQPLLLYGTQVPDMPDIQTEPDIRMTGYAEADAWWGGAWLTSPLGDAVIFTGTKALGENWYGFANGLVWDFDCAENPAVDCPAVPEFPYEDRGFWAEDFIPAMLFYNPDDLAQVAQGTWAPSDPQPYALLDLSEYWLDPEIRLEVYRYSLVGAAAFDRQHGILYVVERQADGEITVIHVFQIAEN